MICYNDNNRELIQFKNNGRRSIHHHNKRGKENMSKNKNNYQRNFPITWEQFHRDSRALAWRLLDTWVLFPWDSEITSNFVNPIINQND